MAARSNVCAPKMATGSGKTIVMAMVIAWHILNKVTYPQDIRFAKNILVIAPAGRSRAVWPSSSCPARRATTKPSVSCRLPVRQAPAGKVVIRYWHALNWETAEKIAKKRSVDKRGAKSDEAYVREVLGDIATARNILVINDEAHHAWRVPAESKVKGITRDEIEEATKWVGGLDRINKARGLLTCYDFSATPFAPSGKEELRGGAVRWIVSDFGLNDAIEAGLVKTPRVVVRDDAVPGRQDLQIPPLSHLQRRRSEGRPEPGRPGPRTPYPTL